ncbi:Protein ERGIC-53 [Phlyctochytrium planicorne]|nr:Protein ERGIC-53 [Phlyctochytrium planicorne]
MLLRLLFFLIAIVGINARQSEEDPEAVQNDVVRKYDYHLSLKKPYFPFPNSDTLEIPYFDMKGNAMASTEYIRLTPSVAGLQGSVWTKSSNPHASWQIEFSFSAFGRAYIGGDGLAFWYTKDAGIGGPVYGSIDKWMGLGLIFDTAESSQNRFTPYIYAIINDGTKEINNRPDALLHAVGGCFRDYRNAPNPVWARVSYVKKTLRLDMDLKHGGRHYVKCFESHGVNLPIGYHFGVSAGTSEHSADDHDLISFEGYEVDPPHKKKKETNTYKLDDEVKKKIESATHVVEDYEKDNVGDVQENHMQYDPQIVQMLEENQFKIVESIDILYQLLDPEGAARAGHEDARTGIHDAVRPIDEKVTHLNSRLEDLGQKVHHLTSYIEALHTVIKDSHAKGGETLREVARKLEESTLQLDAAHEAFQKQPGGVSFAFSSMFFLLGGVLVYLVSIFLHMSIGAKMQVVCSYLTFSEQRSTLMECLKRFRSRNIFGIFCRQTTVVKQIAVKAMRFLAELAEDVEDNVETCFYIASSYIVELLSSENSDVDNISVIEICPRFLVRILVHVLHSRSPEGGRTVSFIASALKKESQAISLQLRAESLEVPLQGLFNVIIAYLIGDYVIEDKGK